MLAAHHEEVKGLLGEGLTVVRVQELLAGRGVVVPERTLHRYVLEVLGRGRSARKTTVRVADGEPGRNARSISGRWACWPMASPAAAAWCTPFFTAAYSRHCYVHLSFRQDLPAVIAGFDAAWAFFGGVFKVVIPDNMSAIVDRAHPTEPRFNQAFAEYAQDRGFLIDPAGARRPTDKPRVERMVPFVRGSFFAGEEFAAWPTRSARRRPGAPGGPGSGSTGPPGAARPSCSPWRAPRLLAAPVFPYDLPVMRARKSTATITSR